MIPVPHLALLLKKLDTSTLWFILKYVKDNPRCKYSLLSLLVSGAVVRYVIWTIIPYLHVQGKIVTKKKTVADSKQAIRELCAGVTAEDTNMIERDVGDLRKEVKSENVSAEHLLKLFFKKALDIDQEVNAITEPIMDAMELSRQLDRNTEKDGLLFGIPISIKECLDIKGYDTTAGIAHLLENMANDDCVVVKVLKAQGAIPFVRTNMPQAGMSHCSSNYIYGETLNPHNKARSPGGSSSGEGALIGAGGSIMGIGTDIGGSIRIPAAFCECYSLKVTSKRVSKKGILTRTTPEIKACVCPIARDFRCLKLLCKALMSDLMYELDPTIPYQPFKKSRLSTTDPMRIGYFIHDGNVVCQPPVIRAVTYSKLALENMGHTLVPVTLSEMSPPGFDAGELYGRLLLADRCWALKQILSVERHERAISLLFSLTSLPSWLLRIFSFFVSLKDEPAAKKLNACAGFRSVEEYMSHVANFKLWKDTFTQSWLDMELDAIICPVFPGVVPKKELMPWMSVAGVYCYLFNSLDYPAATMPITRVTKQDIRNCFNSDHYDPTVTIDFLLLESVQGSEGLPMAVQIVALPYREETCLRVIKEIEGGLARSHHSHQSIHHHHHHHQEQSHQI